MKDSWRAVSIPPVKTQIQHLPALSIRNASKHFGRGAPALDKVSFSVRKGEMVGLLGASGSGKSTLIRAMAGLMTLDADEGLIEIGCEVMQSGGRLPGTVRMLRQRTGVVFQQFNLVGQISVMANVMVGAAPRVPLWRTLIGRFPREERLKALEALGAVGLEAQAWQRASTLSGGQQQRVALARTLVQGAEILLADEPVASLDPESARRVMELIRTLNQTHHMTVVISLHQVHLARRYCPRIVALKRGRMVYDGPAEGLSDAALRDLYGSDAADLFEHDDPSRLSPGLATESREPMPSALINSHFPATHSAS